jgi:hypothetical protein
LLVAEAEADSLVVLVLVEAVEAVVSYLVL